VIVLAIVFRGIGALAGYAVASLGTLLVGRHRVAAGERFDAASLVRFAGPVVALVGLSATQLNVDLLLVQAFGGSSEDIGWYAAAQQVARAPYLALTGLGMALLPVVARRDAEQDHSGLANTVRQATRFALILLAPAVAVLAVTAPAVIDLLYSERYAPGAAPLPLLMPGMASLALFSILASALTGMARPWLPVAIAAGGLAATVAAAIALIPRYGLVGAALATTIGGAVSLGAALAVLTRLVGPVLPVMTAIRVAGAAVGAAAALAVLRPTGLALVIVVGLVVAGYGALLVVLRELDAADWRRISGVVGRRR
jgi:stage V sporulation protein B